MKPLKLSDKQLYSILEMARSLYPEYNKEDFQWGIEHHIPSDTCFVVLSKDDGDIWIHWFEFVTEHLYFKLYSEENGYIKQKNEDEFMEPFDEHWLNNMYNNFKNLKQ